jgi:hypothetical protein
VSWKAVGLSVRAGGGVSTRANGPIALAAAGVEEGFSESSPPPVHMRTERAIRASD